MTTLLVFSNALAVLVVAFILYGLEYGMAEGTQRALVADFAPPEIKGAVLGAYHTSRRPVKLRPGLAAAFLILSCRPHAPYALRASSVALPSTRLSRRGPEPHAGALGGD